MRKRYTVFAALYDDTNQGWIWMPKEKGFNSRDYITLKSTETSKKITCTCRIIDDNFLMLRGVAGTLILTMHNI